MQNINALRIEPTNPKEFIWEQMFRPNTINDVALPKEYRDELNSYIEKGRIPSIILYSPKPGTGKTTTARALSNDIGCPNPLFINASRENNIETIRTTVTHYASTVSIFGDAATKVVILDEAERLSSAAQESLKGILEEVSRTCSFILTTNDISRVNKPLVSRCRRFDFIWSEAQSKEVSIQILQRVFGILNYLEVAYDPKAIAALVKRSFPDNRSLLGDLQSFYSRYNKIDIDILNFVSGTDFKGLIEVLKKKDFNQAAQWSMDNYEAMGSNMFGQFFRYVCPVGEPEARKVKNESVLPLTMILSEAQKPKNCGVDGYLQTLGVLVEIMQESSISFK